MQFRPRSDPDDPLAFDQDALVGEGLLGQAVDQPAGVDEGARRSLLRRGGQGRQRQREDVARKDRGWHYHLTSQRGRCVGRVRKSSAGDIPVLMPDGKPLRRTGRGRRIFLSTLMGILAAAAIAALVMLLG